MLTTALFKFVVGWVGHPIQCHDRYCKDEEVMSTSSWQNSHLLWLLE